MDTLAPPSLSPSAPLPRWRRLRRRCFFAVVRGLAGAVSASPRPVATGLLRSLARVAWWTRRGERQIALANLRHAFPDQDQTAHAAVARRSLDRLAGNLVDALRADREVRLRASDRLRFEALRQSSRPTLFLTAHLGCWEALGRFLSQQFDGLGVITANPHNDAVYAWLRESRERFGLRTFDRDHEARAAARWIAAGRPLAILADLRPRGASVQADWFGVPSPTLVTPGRWAARFGADLVPAGIRRDGEGHEVFLGQAVEVEASMPDVELAQRCNRALEHLITQARDEWVWFHDRQGNPSGRLG